MKMNIVLEGMRNDNGDASSRSAPTSRSSRLVLASLYSLLIEDASINYASVSVRHRPVVTTTMCI